LSLCIVFLSRDRNSRELISFPTRRSSDLMSKGFNRMMKYKKINKNLVGFMRATEVTVNNIDNSYNQHMHVLVCVESTYFYNTENYVNQKQWIQFWKRAMKLDYDPNVKV